MTDYPVGATGTAFEILEALAAAERAGVTALAEELDRSKGSVHDHLATLEQLGYVVKDDGEYRLGLRFLDVGAGVRERMTLSRVGRSEVAQLASSSGETASLVVEEAGDAVVLHREGDEDERGVRVGSRLPLHASAAGKAILANRPGGEVDLAFREDVDDETPLAVVDRDDFEAALQTVRDQGLAFDRGELDPDRRAVAAPIVNGSGRAVGAVVVSGPTERLSGKRLEEDVPGLVLSAANAISVAYTKS